jgi:hypothetical protein
MEGLRLTGKAASNSAAFCVFFQEEGGLLKRSFLLFIALVAALTAACGGGTSTTSGGVNPPPAPNPAPSLTPLIDLGMATYLGFPGGLYPNGSNSPPAAHRADGLIFANRVQPLDTNGNPSPGGKILMLSIGMSNTTQEFCSAGSSPPCNPWTFVGQATADAQVNQTTLEFINGARGGQTASTWDSASDANYDSILTQRLQPLGFTERQVQVAWVKVANASPGVSLPSAQSDAVTLLMQMGNIARALKTRYPNLQLAFFSSRIYAGYATTTLNPEPYAYESAFAVKWLVEAQINQRQSGSIVDARAGDLNYQSGVAPWLAWGAYLWARGASPRSDGLIWLQSDFEADGTHPSQSGEQKVGALLLNFFKQSEFSRCWFVTGGMCP